MIGNLLEPETLKDAMSDATSVVRITSFLHTANTYEILFPTEEIAISTILRTQFFTKEANN